jgi:hypothetical protein
VLQFTHVRRITDKDLFVDCLKTVQNERFGAQMSLFPLHKKSSPSKAAPASRRVVSSVHDVTTKLPATPVRETGAWVTALVRLGR